jgi:curved DNA-binding protein CbpA
MSLEQLDKLDYYTLLGVGRDADAAAIRQAFRAFARKYHPDRHTRADASTLALATAVYRRGSEGLQVLTDPDARKLYERALAQGILRLTAEQRDGAARMFEQQRRSAERPASEPAFRSTQAQTLFDRGEQALARGEAKAAWRAFSAALDVEPGNPRIEKQMYAAERALRGR